VFAALRFTSCLALGTHHISVTSCIIAKIPKTLQVETSETSIQTQTKDTVHLQCPGLPCRPLAILDWCLSGSLHAATLQVMHRVHKKRCRSCGGRSQPWVDEKWWIGTLTIIYIDRWAECGRRGHYHFRFGTKENAFFNNSQAARVILNKSPLA